MSVQTGIVQFRAPSADRRLVAHISDGAAQYGPDGSNEYASGPLCMIYRAFHTTKESRSESQPYLSPTGRVMMWDGRLDNREELSTMLRRDMHNHPTDVAIVMAVYECWGTKGLERLLGDWALSIWDPTENTLILARDYAGVRHLYYCATKQQVIWCTHLASLVRFGGVPLTLSDEFIAGYFALYPEAHLTPYQEIRSVPPGGFVRLNEGGALTHRHWSFNPQKVLTYKSDREYEEHFRHVFREAVRRRLRADSPITAQLSGGIDSSSIVCMADDLISAGEAEAPRLDTVSYFNPREPGGDERSYISTIEEKRGRKGRHVDTSTTDITFSLEDNGIFFPVPGALGGRSAADDPLQKVRVILSGTGGDEFMGGVPDPRPQLADLLIRLRWPRFAVDLLAWSLAKRRPCVQLFFETLVLLLPVSLRSRLAREAAVPDWIDNRFARKYRLAVQQLGPQETFGFRLPSKQCHVQTLLTLARQQTYFQPENEDGLEHRYPFLDRDLVEFVVSIPSTQLLRPGERRSLMRRALAGLVPGEVLSRETKGTGGSCYMRALEGHWPQLEQLLKSPLSSSLGYIRKDAFETTLASAKNGELAPLARITRGLALELWLQHLVTWGILRIDAEGPVAGRAQSSLGVSQATDFCRQSKPI